MNKMKNNRTRLSIASSIAIVASLAPITALAEGTVAPVLQEVTVTTQKREQNLQDVPVAITSYSQFDLDKQGITTVVDIEKSSPNTQLRASRATNSTLTAYIRAVGQQDPLWGFESGVGIYVDDVYYARPQAAVLDVFDVERIEILRGPQGTLYGKNTIGGVIKYVTKKMSGGAGGSITTAIGNYNQQDITVSGQLPVIADKLYIGASYAELSRDGYGDVLTGYDVATGQYSSSKENYNKDVKVGRISVEFTPTDSLFFKFSADKTEDESNQVCGKQSTQTSLTHPATGGVFLENGGRYDSACGTTHKQNVENEGYSFTANYDFNDQLAFKYIYANREGETQQFIDFDGTPLDAFDVPAKYADEQQSHELQVNFTADDYTLVGGIYYFAGNSAGAFDAVLNATVFMGVPFSGTHLDLGVDGDVDTRSLAYYLNGSYNVTDTVTATAGVRYTKDEKNSNIRRSLLITSNSFPYTTTQGSGFTHGDSANDFILAVNTDISDDVAKDDWNEVSLSGKLDWQFRDNMMFYVSYAEGFKSGGFDMRGDASLNPDVADGYDPEIVETWEIGMKSELLDDRLRLNIAIFNMDYTDMQLTVQKAQPAPVFFSSDVLNAGSAEINGVEIEALAQLSDNLSATLVIGHMNAELEEVISGGVDVSDTWEMLNAPDWTGQFGLSYDVDLGSSGQVVVSSALSYRDASRNFNDVTCSCDQDKAYTIWDASAIWYSNDEHWKAKLLLKNLGDTTYKTGGYNQAFGDLVFYGAPRTVTASLSYEF
jgi:iron complex outermembrane receptor protein